MEELNAFEAAILSIQKAGYTREADAKLRHFFHFFDQEFSAHTGAKRRPCSPAARTADCERRTRTGENPATATDLMQDEHAKALQLPRWW